MPEQVNREVDILNAALEIRKLSDRAAYLDKACAGDAALRERVEGLLRAHEEAGNFLETSPATLTLVSLPLAEKPGNRIGRYKLLQQIGEGGCGVVYMAEQEEPVRRRVALKIIKRGMDTKNIIGRFEAERQVLAIMDHPNIAKVLDAGATETGRPFFVMELVRGVPITGYCDENSLPMRERLGLFIQVCRAVQHAHQKGIIHRDLKPSNILVTINDGMAVPKVIDFGIAKATTGQQLTDKTLFTAFDQFIGTPAYMSPEQAVMTSLDIDTRSDIYSLGVLLYELLTGKTPFDAKELLKAGFDEMRRTIREVEPAKPSTRLSTMVKDELTTTAKHRHTEPPRLIHLVRADLDWIVMKCLEKDRARRYETANGLAADIERHLNNEPIVARPPSRLYRFEKMVRRNKLAFAAASAVAVALVLGFGLSTWLFLEEKEARRRAVVAEHSAEQARTLAEQNLRDAQAAIDQFTTQIGRSSLANIPGLYPLREQFLRDGIAYYERLLQRSPDDPALREKLADSLWNLGDLGRVSGDLVLAIQCYQREVEILEALIRDVPNNSEHKFSLAIVLGRLGYVHQRTGNTSESIAFNQRSTELFKELAAANLSDPRLHRFDSLNESRIVKSQREQGEPVAALQTARELLERREQAVVQHPGDPDILRELAFGYTDYADALQDNGQFDDALQAREKSARMEEQLAAAHPGRPDYRYALVISEGKWGETLRRMDKTEDAMRKFSRCLALAQELAKANPAIGKYRRVLGRVYGDLGTTEFVQEHYESALQYHQQAFGVLQKLVADYPQDSEFGYDLAFSLTLVAEAAAACRRPAEALDAATRAREILQTLPDASRSSTRSLTLRARVEGAWGFACQSAGRTAEARQTFERAIELLQQRPQTRDSYHRLLARFRAALAGLPATSAEEKTVAASAPAPTVSAVSMEPSISTTSESQAPATILDVQATDLPTLSQSASKVATVHGKVSEVVLHPAGHILFINFEGVPRTGFLAIVLKENLDAVHAAFNGDLNAAIRGRNVRITGQIVLYKDRPEIIISRADQIQLD